MSFAMSVISYVVRVTPSAAAALASSDLYSFNLRITSVACKLGVAVVEAIFPYFRNLL